MKKLFSILLVALLSISLVACGGGNNSSSSKSKDKSVDEVKQIMLDKGYNVSDSDEGDLFFEEGLVAVKGIDFDHDGELLLFTYYEFPKAKDIEKLRTDCNGDAFEKINDNFYAYTDGSSTPVFYIALGETHTSIVYPFGDVEQSSIIDTLSEIGLPVK